MWRYMTQHHPGKIPSPNFCRETTSGVLPSAQSQFDPGGLGAIQLGRGRLLTSQQAPPFLWGKRILLRRNVTVYKSGPTFDPRGSVELRKALQNKAICSQLDRCARLCACLTREFCLAGEAFCEYHKAHLFEKLST